jgi:hypothetical protein
MTLFGTEATVANSLDMNCVSQIATWLVTFHIRCKSSRSFDAEECLLGSKCMKCVRNFAILMNYSTSALGVQSGANSLWSLGFRLIQYLVLQAFEEN